MLFSVFRGRDTALFTSKTGYWICILTFLIAGFSQAADFSRWVCTNETLVDGVQLSIEPLGSIGDGGHYVGNAIESGQGGIASDIVLVQPDGTANFVIRVGDSVSGAGASYVTTRSRPVVDASGSVAFLAELDLGNATGSNDAAIIGSAAGMTAVVWEGQTPAPGMEPGSEVTSIVSVKFSPGGGLAVQASVLPATGPPKGVLYLGGAGGLTPVVQSGVEYPELPAGTSFSGFVSNPGIFLSGDDAIFFEATLTTAGTVTSSNDSGVWFFQGGGLTEVAREGGSPAGGGNWETVGIASVAASDVFALDGRISGNNVIYAGSVGNLSKVLEAGDSAPGVSGGQFTAFSQNFAIAPNGSGVLSGNLDTAAEGVDFGSNSGLWEWDGVGLSLIVREGDVVPGYPNATFSSLRPALAPNGKVVFQSSNLGQGPTFADPWSTFWITNATGFEELLKHGDTLDFPGIGPTPVSSLSYPFAGIGASIPNGRDGNSSYVNVSQEALIGVRSGFPSRACSVVMSTLDPATPGSITGSVQFDADGDGDTGDPDAGIGLVAVEVFADNGSGFPVGPVLFDTTTAVLNGTFDFPALPPGDYVVQAVASQAMLAANHQWTLPAPSLQGGAIITVTVNPGGSVNGLAFLSTNPVSVIGIVEEDTNFDNVADLSLADATVTLKRMSDSQVIGSVTTDSSGTFQFDLVLPGEYFLEEADPLGFVSVSDSAGANDNRIDLMVVAGPDSTGHAFLDRNDSDFLPVLRGIELDPELAPFTPSSVASGNPESPLVLGINFALLGGAPQVAKGLVADGVTPLIIEVQSQQFLASTTTVRWAMDVEGGNVAGGIYSHAESLVSPGGWMPAIEPTPSQFNEIEFSSGLDSKAYLQISALNPWELLFAPGETELRVNLTLIDPLTENVLGTRTILLRRPVIGIIRGITASEVGPHFLSELEKIRPADFIINRSVTAQILGMFDTFRDDWAFLRTDMIGHGRGALKVIGGSAAFGDNFHRRRYRRLVTIGAPLNGSLLSVYFRALQAKIAALDTSGTLLSFIPASISNFPLWEDFVGTSVNPFITLDPGSSYFTNPVALDNAIPAFHIATKIDPDSAPALRAVGLTGALVDDIFRVVPKNASTAPAGPLEGGIDGLADVGSALNRSPFFSVLMPGVIAPGDSKSELGANVSQLGSREIAEVIAFGTGGSGPLLDGSQFADPFVPPTAMPESVLESIREAASNTPVSTVIDILVLPLPSPGEAIEGGGLASPSASTDYLFEIQPPAAHPVTGDVFWFAEIFGPDGATIEGITTTPDSQDPLKVTVTVEDGLEGDVVVYASYETTGGQIVFARSKVVVSLPPDGETLTGINLEPATIMVDVGDSLFPDVLGIYSGGTTLPRAVTQSDISFVSSSITSAVDVSEPTNWKAVGEGTSTITMTAFGFSDTAVVTVIDPFPPQNFEDWKVARYDTTELSDPMVTGDDVDLDRDTLDLFKEYITGGDDREPDMEFLPRVRNVEIEEVETRVITTRVSSTLLDVERLKMETSASLSGWISFYDFALGIDLANVQIADYRDFGSFYEVDFHVPPGTDRQYFRLAALGELQPGPITGTSILTFEGTSSFDLTYGNRVSGPTSGSFVYGGTPSYTPNVEVRHGFQHVNVTQFAGDLTPRTMRAASDGRLTVRVAADPGHVVELEGFDVGVRSGSGFPTSSPQPASVSVRELTEGMLFEAIGPPIPAATHADFDFTNGDAIGSELEILVDCSNFFSSSQRQGIVIDNIQFSQRPFRDFGDATELTFDHSAASVNQNPTLNANYGDRVTGPVNGAVSYRGSGNFTPNVLSSFPNSSRVEAVGYGNFRECLFANGVLQIVLSADPGFVVVVHRFDLAAEDNRHSSDPVANHVRLTDGSGTTLFEELAPSISYLERTRYNFVGAPIKANSITIEVNVQSFSSSKNVGLDNLLFSQEAAP